MTQVHFEPEGTTPTEGPSGIGRFAERWQAALLVEAHEDQVWAIQQARVVAEDLGRCFSNDVSLAALPQASNNLLSQARDVDVGKNDLSKMQVFMRPQLCPVNRKSDHSDVQSHRLQ